MPNTELHGEVVRWGTDFLMPNASACCETCHAHRVSGSGRNCTVWVFCDGPACGPQHGQCWLKECADPYTDLDLVRDRSGEAVHRRCSVLVEGDIEPLTLDTHGMHGFVT